jgi:predicted PurR-regulated permease PerM
MLVGVIMWGLLGLIVARVLTRFFNGIFAYLVYERTI